MWFWYTEFEISTLEGMDISICQREEVFAIFWYTKYNMQNTRWVN